MLLTGLPLSREGSFPSHNQENLDRRQHKGEPRLPFNFRCACSFFIIEGRFVLVFGTVTLYRCFWRSPSGIKSKRIFLSADLLFR